MKVIVKTQIHGSFSAVSSTDKYMFKVFDLPFVPFVGLTIMHKTSKGEIDDIGISEVIWDNDKNCFICFQKSDEEIYRAELNKESHRTMEEIMQDYFDADWLSEPDRNPK